MKEKSKEIKMETENMKMYRLLNSGEVNGERALVFSGTKGRHSDVGNGGNHHEWWEVVQEYRHE